ncbi:MAG: (5-formylfuran-3-yl)methyl phosphate synthase [Planctomycetaceae bacterium]|nr:(5-formylfuran-3-yl)methyl phosphate synthase [Planctomycetaceae bacterium]
MSVPTAPSLLVSVRDCREAAAAVSGGADIVDVKDPANGPLGYAGPDAVAAIAREVDGRLKVSAALGECRDWLGQDGPQPLSLTQAYPLHWVKLGPAGLADAEDWTALWRQAQQATRPAAETTLAAWPRWVAVAYADSERASSPGPEAILQAAIEQDCAALLVDTFVKDGHTTFDWLGESRLCQLRQTAADAGLLFALAGQISVGHTPQIRDLQPDIVAVRGAVCDSSDRGRAVSADRVRSLKKVLLEAAVSNPGCSRV